MALKGHHVLLRLYSWTGKEAAAIFSKNRRLPATGPGRPDGYVLPDELELSVIFGLFRLDGQVDRPSRAIRHVQRGNPPTSLQGEC